VKDVVPGPEDLEAAARSTLSTGDEGTYDQEEFERLFDAKVGEPLSQLGFQRSGKSLYADANLASVSLIRLGGRMLDQAQFPT